MVYPPNACDSSDRAWHNQRFVILDAEAQNQSDVYPPWCNLNWFHNCHGLEADICKAHYHDFPEIWLWHKNCAEGMVGGQPIILRRGVMAYNPQGSLHSLVLPGPHSNTGIHPRRPPGARVGHLHMEDTGEHPQPNMPAVILQPEQNNPSHPAILPTTAFLQSVYSGSFEEGSTIFEGILQSWLAILVREGQIAGAVDGEPVAVSEPLLLIVREGANIELKATTACDAAFAVGWTTVI